MLLPEDKKKERYFTPIMKVLETLKYTNCRLKLNIKFTREFELLLGDSWEISGYIPQKAINNITLI
jgi:hypothetical protein